MRYGIKNRSWNLKEALSEGTLRKIPQFHQISWCGNFMERHSFGKVRNYAETAFPQNFHTKKLGEITVFFAADVAFANPWIF